MLKEVSKEENVSHRRIILLFLLSLIEQIYHVHAEDSPIPDAEPIRGSYNPPSGVFYYFDPNGEQVRKLPVYDINDKTFEDHEQG